MKVVTALALPLFALASARAADIVRPEQFYNQIYQSVGKGGYATAEIKFLPKISSEKVYRGCVYVYREPGTTNVKRVGKCEWRIVYDGKSIRDVSNIENRGFQALEIWMDSLDVHFFDGSKNTKDSIIPWIAYEDALDKKQRSAQDYMRHVTESDLGL